MKVLLLLAACLYLADGYAVKHCADLVKFGEKFYEKHYILKGSVSKPFHVTYDKTHNRILYHEDSEPYGNTETHFYDVTTKTDYVLDVTDAFDSTLTTSGTYLIATNHGIYEFNPEDHEYHSYALPEVDVDAVFLYKDTLYYTNGENKKLYSYKDGKTTMILDHDVDKVVITKEGDIVFTNGHHLYITHVNSKDIVEVTTAEKLPIEDLVEHDGTVYITSMYGVYVLNLKDHTLQRVSMKGMLFLTFDGEDLIYSDEEHIVRLTPTTKVC